MIEMIAANRESVAVTAKNEHMQIGPRERDAAGEGQGTSMDIMCAMSLNEIGEPAGATDAGNGGDFLMPNLALFNQFEVKRQNRKITAARTPGRVVGG